MEAGGWAPAGGRVEVPCRTLAPRVHDRAAECTESAAPDDEHPAVDLPVGGSYPVLMQTLDSEVVSLGCPSDPPSPGRQVTMGKTVLLVEDNADNQEIYRLILKHHGFVVLQAWDGECGVRMAKHHAPDLILMDLTMPLVDGLEATRMLKADPATSGIPIIALTAHAETEDRDAAAEAGCVSFLSKPVAPNSVAIEVRRILALPEDAAP